MLRDTNLCSQKTQHQHEILRELLPTVSPPTFAAGIFFIFSFHSHSLCLFLPGPLLSPFVWVVIGSRWHVFRSGWET